MSVILLWVLINAPLKSTPFELDIRFVPSIITSVFARPLAGDNEVIAGAAGTSTTTVPLARFLPDASLMTNGYEPTGIVPKFTVHVPFVETPAPPYRCIDEKLIFKAPGDGIAVPDITTGVLWGILNELVIVIDDCGAVTVTMVLWVWNEPFEL